MLDGVEVCPVFPYKKMEKGGVSMKLAAFARLLNKKINSANRKAQNPFLDATISKNPFIRPMYTTVVWVEDDTKYKER